MAMSQGFGKGRRAMIGVSVLASIGVAVVIWAFANYMFTRPKLRTSFDMSPGAQFSISPETEKLIETLRAKDTTLEIDTLFLPKNSDPWGLQARLLDLTQTLLGRISYLGGAKVVLRNNDMRDIQAVKQMGQIGQNIIRLRYGKRKRTLNLLMQTRDGRVQSDLADIQNPDSEGPKNPGQASRPVIRSYRGEEALSSALKELLSEESLKIYWTTSQLSQRPETPVMSSFVRDLTDNGFGHDLIDLEEQAVPKDCDLLFFIQPGDELKRDALERVRAYLLRGGRVLMAVSYDEDIARQGFPQLQHRDLLQPLGLSLSNHMVLNGLPDPAGGTTPLFGRPQNALIQVRSRGLNRNHPVTKPLAKSQRYVDLYRARAIKFAEKRPDDVFADFLLHSNRFSFEESLSGMKPHFTFAPSGQGRPGPKTVAATVQVAKKGRFALVSGLCMISSLPGQAGGFYDGNRDFVLNLVNWLVQRDRLVTVRSKDYRAGRLEVSPQGLTRVKTFLVYVLPIFFMGMAFFTLYWRRRA